MAKKGFIRPIILMDDQIEPGHTPPPGAGSGQGTHSTEDQWPWQDWQFMFDEEDFDGNGTPGEWSDYVKWWQDNGWSEADFIDWNGVGFGGPEP